MLRSRLGGHAGDAHLHQAGSSWGPGLGGGLATVPTAGRGRLAQNTSGRTACCWGPGAGIVSLTLRGLTPEAESAVGAQQIFVAE